MNTVQMYAGKGNNVPPTPQAAKNGPQVPILVDYRQLPEKPICFQPLAGIIDPDYLRQFQLTPQERQRATLLTVATSTMAHLIPLQTVVLAVTLNPVQYADAEGKVVAIALESKPQELVFGRVVAIDVACIKLGFECPVNSGVTIARVSIGFLCLVRYIVTKTVI
ncbi:hypothetical protein GO755_30410 [Spirosoma sp. HMF4905]|uniref:Uncharacterized protein n=1 Tax=Spirosoma arboris TaxID=2682092 RepID=A0A7K1SKU5_9BACT|nr:hypothetical protein [Spirosoma arboris]MVM34384.1 hypothetical protein [Spirosoma arboris]